jgi:hypothetical protein
LFITAEVHKITGFEHVFEGVVKGLIKSFSIGFIPKGYTFYDDDTVEISSASLIEISLAPVQSNPQSLFTVIGTKSLINVKEIKEQNDLTCDSLSCFMSKIKGIKMDIIEKEVTPAAEPVVAPEAKIDDKPAADPKVEVTSTIEPVVPVAAPEPKVDLATLVQSIAEANIKADEIRATQAAEQAAKEQAEKDAQETAKQNRVTDALTYLKEQAELIKNTSPEDLDVDAYDNLYEVVSDVQEALEAKVLAAINAGKTAA